MALGYVNGELSPSSLAAEFTPSAFFQKQRRAALIFVLLPRSLLGSLVPSVS